MFVVLGTPFLFVTLTSCCARRPSLLIACSDGVVEPELPGLPKTQHRIVIRDGTTVSKLPRRKWLRQLAAAKTASYFSQLAAAESLVVGIIAGSIVSGAWDLGDPDRTHECKSKFVFIPGEKILEHSGSLSQKGC